MISQSVIKIYLKSLTIRERVKMLDRIRGVDTDPLYDNMLNHWKLQVGESGDVYFEKRLEWSGINKTDLPKLLNPITNFNWEEYDFPEWVTSLQEFLDSKKALTSSKQFDTVPFKDILLPITKFFSKEIGYDTKIITQDAFQDLENEFTKMLSKLASQSLLEYMIQEQKGYKELVNSMPEPGYSNFFSEFAYLARLIFTRGNFWAANTNSMLRSFASDTVVLAQIFKTDSLIITGIKSELSESHNAGKNVSVIKTNAGRLVYKNRDLNLEKSFYDFLKKTNINLSSDHYIPWVINGDTYGWMEFIEHSACTDIGQVQKHYKRTGSLLCLFYLFGATDLHSENIIANSEYPIFIDLETLLSPVTKLNNKNLNKLNDFIDQQYGLSVSRIGILPQWLLGPDTNVYNNSALGGSKEGLKYPAIVWENINKDTMLFDYAEVTPPDDKNKVYLNGAVQEPSQFYKYIKEGFEETYKFLLENKNNEEVLKCLTDFNKRQTRFVFRATKVYTLLLDYLNHPDYMKSGCIRSIEFEVLAKGLLTDLNKKYIFWDVLEQELQQLENNDIPYFGTNTSSLDILSVKGPVCKNALQDTGYANLLKRFENLSKPDLKFQQEIILNSIKTKNVNNLSGKFTKFANNNVNIPKKDNVEKILNNISDRVIDSRIELDGRATWVSYVSNVVSHTYGYKPIGLDMANGNMGVAVFLAGMFFHTGEVKYLTTLKSAVQPVADVLDYEWSSRELIERLGTGGTTGIGSIIYSMVKLYEFTQEETYKDLALRFFKIIKPEHIKKSIRQDVVSGNAGLLLSLIKLSTVVHDEKILRMMGDITTHLIQTGYVQGKFSNWNYQQDKTLLGFSHGSSGVLYAISRYLTYSDSKDEILSIIHDILNYEESLYNQKENNWPDYRFGDANFDVVSWCHGAVGIGMSRLELLNEDIARVLIEKDITRAIEKTLQTGEHFLDTACCGNGGRLDFLLELKNTKFYNKKHENFNKWLLQSLINRYEKNGDFKYFSKFRTEDVNVGFYQGLSGIGYQLLRTLDSVKFKSVLLFK